MATIEDYKKALIKAHNAGDTVAANLFARKIKESKQVVQQPSVQNPDVPAGGTVPAFTQEPQPERSFGETLGGIGEAALTMGTGATGGALGFLAGSVPDVIDKLAGNPDKKLRESFAGALTNTPEGAAGQEFVGDIGAALGTLPPVGLTGGVIPKIAAPSLKIPKSRNKTLNVLGEAAPDNIQKSFTKKLGEDRFEPRIFGMVKEARKQGFDDSVTAMIANSTKNNKRSMSKQVALIKRVKGNAREKALQGAADIAGDALLKNIDFVNGNKSQAGVQLGRVANRLKGKAASVTDPVNSFFKDMERLGVEFDGNGKPNFEAAVFEGTAPAENLVNKISLRLKRNNNFTDTDGFKAHEFKKFIDENVNFEKSEGGLSGRVDRAVKSLRSGINESVNDISPDYKQANKQFSDTITALDELQDVAGRKLDFKGANADKAAGVLLRSQLNNTGKRANLLTAIGNLEDVAKKYGGNFDDDVLTLSIFADELESIFGSRTRTAIRNEAKKGGVDAAIDISQMTIPGALAVGAKAGARRLRGINEANQLKAIERLLKQ
tara:strand:+ start:1005 stop:2654 length:1650 start_codon:yes stop_codon:yes gene_type:complete